MKNATNNNAPTMTERLQTCLLALVDIAMNTVSTLPFVVTGSYPVAVKQGEPEVRVTKAQAASALTRYVNTAIDSGFKACDQLPPSPAMSAMHGVLKETYPISAGKNKGVRVPLLAYALNRVAMADRRQARADNRTAALAKAEADGGVWYAEGVTTKDGVDIPYPYESKARKAWARQHIGDNWYEGDKKGNLAKAVVKQGAFTESERARMPAATTTTSTDTLTASDEVLIAAAQALGSKASTVKGARKYLSNLNV